MPTTAGESIIFIISKYKKSFKSRDALYVVGTPGYILCCIPTTAGIYVTGSDYYLTGNLLNSAVVWKNGNTPVLYTGTYYSTGNSIFVLGSDIYVAGQEVLLNNLYSIAKMWKNGFAVNLTSGTSEAEAKSIFVK